jgi:hypothetical protein
MRKLPAILAMSFAISGERLLGPIVSDQRGTIYLGEDERISKLYLFYP